MLMNKTYFNFSKEDFLTEQELIHFIRSTPVEKAELLAKKLINHISIYNEQVYIKHVDEYNEFFIQDHTKYVQLMARKLVNQSFCYVTKDILAKCTLNEYDRRFFEFELL